MESDIKTILAFKLVNKMPVLNLIPSFLSKEVQKPTTYVEQNTCPVF